jgi:hypothetical protein
MTVAPSTVHRTRKIFAGHSLAIEGVRYRPDG